MPADRRLPPPAVPPRRSRTQGRDAAPGAVPVSAFPHLDGACGSTVPGHANDSASGPRPHEQQEHEGRVPEHTAAPPHPARGRDTDGDRKSVV